MWRASWRRDSETDEDELWCHGTGRLCTSVPVGLVPVGRVLDRPVVLASLTGKLLSCTRMRRNKTSHRSWRWWTSQRLKSLSDTSFLDRKQVLLVLLLLLANPRPMAGDYAHVRVHTVPQPTAGEPYHFYSLGVATYPCYVFRYFFAILGEAVEMGGEGMESHPRGLWRPTTGSGVASALWPMTSTWPVKYLTHDLCHVIRDLSLLSFICMPVLPVW